MNNGRFLPKRSSLVPVPFYGKGLHGNDQITHTIFKQLPCFLNAGDVLVINTSGTEPFYDVHPALPSGGTVTLHTPYNRGQRGDGNGRVRLWVATL